jgi:hypothetical protein
LGEFPINRLNQRRRSVRCTLLHVAAGLGLASVLGLATAMADEKPKSGAPIAASPLIAETTETSCHGTNVDFLDTPSEAATKAKKEEKLVFILHVSGNFEDPKFT